MKELTRLDSNFDLVDIIYPKFSFQKVKFQRATERWRDKGQLCETSLT